jgi:replicative DNA helicase
MDFDKVFEQEMIYRLLKNRDYFIQAIPYLEPKYFDSPGTKKVFEKIKDFYSEYQQIPTIKDIITLSKKENPKDKELIKEVIKEAFDKEASHLNEELLLKETEDFIKQAIFKESLLTGVEGIKNGEEKKLQESFRMAEEAMKVSLFENFGVQIDDVDDTVEYITDNTKGLFTGIPSFDKRLGKGIYSKSLTTVLAPPGIGKTATMIAFGCEFLKQGEDVVYISLEMNEYEIMKRFYANLLDIDISTLEVMEPLLQLLSVKGYTSTVRILNPT